MNARAAAAVTLAANIVGLPTNPDAQGLGSFRRQLRPFCNLVTLSVGQEGGIYTLDGFDDQCGAEERGGVVGTAFLNPDGSIGLSLTMVGAGAAPVVLQARLDPKRFLRIHRSTIVQAKSIRSLQRRSLRGVALILLDGTRLAVGPSFVNEMTQAVHARRWRTSDAGT